MPSSSNMPATRPRWSKTWLRYMGWSGITLSSDLEESVKDLQENTKIAQTAESDAESRIYSSWHHDSGVGAAQGRSWTAVYALCIVGTAVPTLMGYVASHRLHEGRPGQRGRQQDGSIDPAAPQDFLIDQGRVTR